MPYGRRREDAAYEASVNAIMERQVTLWADQKQRAHAAVVVVPKVLTPKEVLEQKIAALQAQVDKLAVAVPVTMIPPVTAPAPERKAIWRDRPEGKYYRNGPREHE
jgi:hypothetical protein